MTCEVRDHQELQNILADVRGTFPRKFADIETVMIFDNMVKYRFF